MFTSFTSQFLSNLGISVPNFLQLFFFLISVVSAAKDLIIGLIFLLILSAGSIIIYWNLSWSILIPTTFLFFSLVLIVISLFAVSKRGGGPV